MTWISFTRQFTDILLEKAMAVRSGLRGSHLITLAPPRSESIPALLGLFHPVFGLVEGFQWLPKEELVEVIVTGRCVGSVHRRKRRSQGKVADAAPRQY